MRWRSYVYLSALESPVRRRHVITYVSCKLSPQRCLFRWWIRSVTLAITIRFTKDMHARCNASLWAIHSNDPCDPLNSLRKDFLHERWSKANSEYTQSGHRSMTCRHWDRQVMTRFQIADYSPLCDIDFFPEKLQEYERVLGIGDNRKLIIRSHRTCSYT